MSLMSDFADEGDTPQIGGSRKVLTLKFIPNEEESWLLPVAADTRTMAGMYRSKRVAIYVTETSYDRSDTLSSPRQYDGELGLLRRILDVRRRDVGHAPPHNPIAGRKLEGVEKIDKGHL